jgi:tripartite-type tricarboxylate transporter receptor subunit TctC
MYRLTVICAAVLLSMPVRAQPYPAKPILMIVPVTGAVEVMMRIVTQKMSDNLKQQIVTEIQPGAGGLIGTERVARAAPDGYTIGGLSDSVVATLPSLYAKVSYDPVNSFAPVSMVAAITWALVVHNSIPARNVKELIALAKARPGQLDYASGGNGSPHHIVMEMYKAAMGSSLTHVPYRGATQGIMDVVSGRIPVMFSALANVLPFVEAGKLRAVGIVSAQRSPLLPAVPTLSESGLPGFVFTTWAGIYAPQGTPRTIVDLLNAETVKAVNDAAVRDRLLALGLDPGTSTPEQLAIETRKVHAERAKIIKNAGIKVE